MRTMESAALLRVQVAMEIETPVARDEDHRAVGRGVDRDFKEERTAVLPAVKVPVIAERIEQHPEAAVRSAPLESHRVAKISLMRHHRADPAPPVAILCDIEAGGDLFPRRAERGIVFQSFFEFIEFL